MVVTQDGGLQLVLPGWPLGCCFPTASRARSHVIVLVEAWADSELGESRKSEAVSTCPRPSWSPERHTHCSGDSSTVAMNGRVDFPKKKLAHQCPGSALGRPKRSKAKSGCCCHSLGIDLGTEGSPHSPGWWGMASPGYSALPQELLLEVEPRRPGEKRPAQLHRAPGLKSTRPSTGFTGSSGRC